MHTTLVATAELANHLQQWRVFDCRHDLAQPALGEQQYRQAHIPGALFASLERNLSAPKTGKNGRHPLPDPVKFAAWLGELGLAPGDQIVCYDASSGSMAARLWWLLRWVGHEAAAVLDGGFAKWTREGRAVDAVVPRFTPFNYPLKVRSDASLDVAAVAKNLKFCAARGMSTRRASFTGFPLSTDSIFARGSRFFSMRSAMRSMMRQRSSAGVLDHSGKASLADCAAKSTSFSPESGTRE